MFNGNSAYKNNFCYLVILLAGIICLSSCNKETLDIGGGSTVSLEQYLEDNNITATSSDEGYYFVVEQENAAGQALSAGDIANIYYTLSDLEGNLIDEIQAADSTIISLQYGTGTVFPVGLDLGLSKMKTGEIYTFYLPPGLAYGEISSSVTAGPVIIQVELLSKSNTVQQKAAEENLIDQYLVREDITNAETYSSGLRVSVMETGIGRSPATGQEFTFTYSMRLLNNTLIEENTLTEVMGENDLITGLQDGIERMQPGETSLFLMPSGLAYGPSVRVIPHFIKDDLVSQNVIPDYAAEISPFSVLLFEVTLQ